MNCSGFVLMGAGGLMIGVLMTLFICVRGLTRASTFSLPEIWDKMTTDMRTLTEYGDQILL